MEFTKHLDALQRAGARILDAAGRGLDAPVPCCPGWDVAELVRHVGVAHWWAAANVAAGGEQVRLRERPTDPTREELPDWYAERVRALHETLASIGPDAPVWTFVGERPSRFWARRQVHEATVHGWDAFDAHGQATTLDPAVCADGIDEFLAVFAVRAGALSDDTDASVHLHCTDVEGEWLVRLDGDGPVIERVHAKGDVAARGTAADLLLHLWGRVPVDRLETFGDLELLERFRRHAVV